MSDIEIDMRSFKEIQQKDIELAAAAAEEEEEGADEEDDQASQREGEGKGPERGS